MNRFLILTVCVAGILVLFSCNPGSKDFPLNNKLVKAIKGKNPDTVKEILDSGVFDINEADKNGATPLMYAAYLSETAVVKELIEHNALLNSKDSSGTTALMWACKAQNTDTVILLLEKGANPTLTNEEDNSARDIAMDTGNDEIVSILKKEETMYEERVYYVIDQLKEIKYLMDQYTENQSSPEYAPLVEEINSLVKDANRELQANNTVKAQPLLDAAYYLVHEINNLVELDSRTVTVNGKVYRNGEPVENARVTALYVSDWEKKELVELTTVNTGAGGTFTIDLATDNCYFLEAEAGGVTTASYIDLYYDINEEIIINVTEEV